MRLGLLGPAEGDLEALAHAAEFALNVAKVTKAIYLGDDAAMEDIVELWAQSLVGEDPTDGAIWERAFEVARSGSPEQIDEFLKAERNRLRLKALESLPAEALRSVEMFGDRVAVLIHDKALLDEEDIYSATMLVYGKSDQPMVKKIGTRWFLSPGKIGSPGGGLLVLDDEAEDIVATIYDKAGAESHRAELQTARSAKMRVQGET